jgi:hypothetical protein
MKKFNLLTFVILGLLSSVGFTSSALAASDCLGNNNIVCITETYIPAKDLTVYSITNNSTERIYGFGVTNDTQGRLDTSYSKFIPSGMFFTIMPTWIGTQYNATSWDSSAASNIGLFKTSGVSSFAQLFGTDDPYVNFYWNSDPSANQLNSGVTLDGFYFYGGMPKSNFVAFGSTGNVIASFTANNTAAVPEPETYAMFLTGLGLMGFVSRRRKA